MRTNSTSARTQLEAAHAAQVALNEAYSTGSDAKTIASLHQAINFGLKSAEVRALIDVAEALKGLEGRPGRPEFLS